MELEAGEARETFTVIAGSGTGELRNLRGEGGSSVGHGTEFLCLLEYQLD